MNSLSSDARLLKLVCGRDIWVGTEVLSIILIAYGSTYHKEHKRKAYKKQELNYMISSL